MPHVYYMQFILQSFYYYSCNYWLRDLIHVHCTLVIFVLHRPVRRRRPVEVVL